MGELSMTRYSLWGAAILFSAITIAIASHLLWWETFYFGVYSTFAAMAIATGSLTLLTLPVFIGIDQSNNGAVTSMIVTEIVVINILWILWLTTAALTANATNGVNFSDCAAAAAEAQAYGYTGFGDLVTICHEIPAIEAFSFLTFFALLGYAIILLVFTLIAHNRGNSEIWMQSVNKANFPPPTVNPPPPGGLVGFNEKATGGVPLQYQYPPYFVPPPQQLTPQGVPYGVPPPQQPIYPGSPEPQQPMSLPLQPGQPEQPRQPEEPGDAQV